MKKAILLAGALTVAMAALTACSGNGKAEPETTVQAAESAAETQKETTAKAEETTAEAAKEAEAQTVTIAAAASLETCLRDELIPLFEEQNPGFTVVGTYDSSGKLQTQIEEGAGIDVFFSAATKQMDALNDEGMIQEGSMKNLLENKIVFIVPTGDEGSYSSFEDIAKAENAALGDPDSVPVGQYSKEALTNLGLWDEVLAKASLGTNVTEVLNWVAEGSAKAGIVYATDAAQTDKVTIVAEAPEGSVKKAIYPAGIIKDCENPEGAQNFIDFLAGSEAMEIFVKNGFAAAQ